MKCSQKQCHNQVPSDSPFLNCVACRERDTLKKQKARTRRREEGCCLSCGVILVDTPHKQCQKCLEKKRVYEHKYSEEKEKTSGKSTTQVTKKALWEKARELRQGSRDRAAKEGADHKIAIWHIYDRLIDGHCEITGLPFIFGTKSHGIWSPSLDRWDPQNPNYTEENTKIVIWGLNQFKFRWSTPDWLLLLERCLAAFGIIPSQPDQTLCPRTLELDLCKWNLWRDQTKHRAQKENGKFELLCEDFENAIKEGLCQVTGLPFDFSGIEQPDFSELLNPRSDSLHQMLFPDIQKSEAVKTKEVTPLTPLRARQKKVVYNPWVPSVHRLDPTNSDYSRENTQFVCWAYNVAKSNFRDEDFKIFLQALGQKLGYIEGGGPLLQLLKQSPALPEKLPQTTPISILGAGKASVSAPVAIQLERDRALDQLVIPSEMYEVSDGDWKTTFDQFEKDINGFLK